MLPPHDSAASEWYEACARPHEADLRQYLQRITARADVDDLVQETFLASMKAAANFRADSKLTTWLIAILRNQFSLHLRGRRKWSHAPLEAAGGVGAPEPRPASQADRDLQL